MCPLCEEPCLKRRAHLVRAHQCVPGSKALRDLLARPVTLAINQRNDTAVSQQISASENTKRRRSNVVGSGNIFSGSGNTFDNRYEETDDSEV